LINNENAKVPKDLIQDVISNINHNIRIIDYYTKFDYEMQKYVPDNDYTKTIENKILNMNNCNRLWVVDVYHQSKIKDFIKTSLCKDKFCSNCKKVKQASRMGKYMPELEKYKNQSYHLTLTQPNVSGSNLKKTIKLMAASYKSLTRYLTGNLLIKGFDFSTWGYEGSIRSLEVTFRLDDYHPHYHCLMVLNGLKMSSKDIINTYSYSNGKLTRYFSQEEILIQKIWYLLINKQKVNKENIDQLQLGYSSSMDKLKTDDFNELFKYMTKATDEDNNILTYENFKVLNAALYRKKQIQGYGCLYQLIGDDELDIDSIEKGYQRLIDEYRKIENPEYSLQSPQDLLQDNDYTLISRKTYVKHLKTIVAST